MTHTALTSGTLGPPGRNVGRGAMSAKVKVSPAVSYCGRGEVLQGAFFSKNWKGFAALLEQSSTLAER
jgi:hypothetical protein